MRLFFLVCFSLLSALAIASKTPTGLLRELEEARSDTSRIKVYTELTDYYMSSDYDSSVHYASQALALARATRNHKGEYTLLNRLASVYHAHGNLTLSKEFAQEALTGFERIRDQEGIALSYLTLGTITGKGGHFPEATSYILQALRIFEKTRNKKGMFDAYIKLGLINEQSGNLDQALEYYTKGKALLKAAPSVSSSLSLQNNIGVVYAKKGNMREALKYFIAGVQHADSLVHADLYISSLTNAGNAYQHLGSPDTALSFHQRSLAKARQFRLPEKESQALINIAAIYVDRKNFTEALRLLDKSRKIAESIGHAFLLSEIYEAYIGIYEEQGNYKDAFLISQKQRALDDSLFNKDRKRAAERLQVEYDKERSKAKIKTLETLSGKTTLQRNVGVTVAVLVIVMLMVVYFSLYNMQRLNKRLKVSNQVKDKLFSIIGHDLRGPMGSVVQMLTLMENDVLKPNELKEIAQILKKHTEVSLSTLDSLLEWGKTQIQGVRVKEKVFEVAGVVQQNRDFFFAACAAKKLTLVSEIPETLQVSADPDHFGFVLRNLISNAIKFSYPDSLIELKSTVNDGMVCISVKDYGKGMEESDAEQLFETFNLRNDGTNGEKGTGIGLMLCKEFVQANGGRIWAHSKLEQGAEFFFTCKHVS